jgi:hypothetical protein
MAKASIVLQVILPSTERSDEILIATANRLGIERITPDSRGRAELWMQLSGPEAFDAVRQALQACGRDWGEYVWLRHPEQALAVRRGSPSSSKRIPRA